jgi:ATP adenylyltransferase
MGAANLNETELGMSRQLDCHLCSQISGESANDLIAKTLGYETYRRTVLLETERFVVFPSLGALTVGHCLVCPKEHSQSIASLSSKDKSQLSSIARTLTLGLSRLLKVPVHQFEHGSMAQNQRVICSVGHAHLHLLPASVAASRILEARQWRRVHGGLEGIGEMTGSAEYLLYIQPSGDAWIEVGGSFESQVLRRLFARELGLTDEWNWREHRRSSVVSQTIQLFHGSPSLQSSLVAANRIPKGS